MTDFGKHFKSHEFDSPDLPNSGINMQQAFIDRLNRARELAGVPFKINSGFRSANKNRAEGGKPDSAHLTGWAADIDLTGDSRQRYHILKAVFQVFDRIGIAKGFIHVDCDPTKDKNVTWTY